jgi:hypothetical protein
MQFVQINTKNQLDRIVNVNNIVEMHIEQECDDHYREIKYSFLYVIFIRYLGPVKVSKELYFEIRKKLMEA